MTISSVTSEALQLKLRQLLPSQQGFGTDLSASDTIIPVIDLTASAEGSDVRADLQVALAFGSITAIEADNATVVIANSPGFYRIFGIVSMIESTVTQVTFTMTDGSATKNLMKFRTFGTGGASSSQIEPLDFNVYLSTGESISVAAIGTYSRFSGSVRQIADNNGTLVQPVGFTPQ